MTACPQCVTLTLPQHHARCACAEFIEASPYSLLWHRHRQKIVDLSLLALELEPQSDTKGTKEHQESFDFRLSPVGDREPSCYFVAFVVKVLPAPVPQVQVILAAP